MRSVLLAAWVLTLYSRVPHSFALFANECGCHNLTEIEVTVKLELLWLL
jgi:hypothetical protein